MGIQKSMLTVVFQHYEDVILIILASVIPVEKSAGNINAVVCLWFFKVCTFSSSSLGDFLCLWVSAICLHRVYRDSPDRFVELTHGSVSESGKFSEWKIARTGGSAFFLSLLTSSQTSDLQLLILQPSRGDKISLGSSDQSRHTLQGILPGLSRLPPKMRTGKYLCKVASSLHWLMFEVPFLWNLGHINPVCSEVLWGLQTFF